jgi:hypothetical protein
VPLTHRFYWAASVERCFSDITTNGLGTNVQDIPDFASHLRYEGDRGHVQVAGLARSIGYRPTGGMDTHETATGVSGSLVFHPWAVAMGTNPVTDECPSGLTRSRILMMCTGGSGVGRFINDLAGQGLDAQVDPITGELQLVDAFGWNASYEHWFNDKWLANFTYASIEVDSNINQPATTYDSATYQAASLWWIPVPRMAFAVEYIWGDRENINGDVGRADRVHGLAQYNF